MSENPFQQPTVEPSEPEREARLIEHALEKVSNPDCLKQVNLRAAYEKLRLMELDLDDEGFIVDADTGEYKTPHMFSDTLFDEVDQPSDDPFNAYFASRDDDSLHTLPTQSRLHLKDLHSFYTDENGTVHPISSDSFQLERFHRATGVMSNVIMGWSELLIQPNDVDIHFSTFGSEFDESDWEIHCFGADCDFSAPPEDWNGDENEPECPSCGGQWSDKITVCTACQESHRGMNMVGEGMYSEPACPHCDKGEFLETQTRYDSFPSE